MGYLFVAPQWFFGYDMVLELIFAIITLLVSIYAYKVYKLSEEQPLKLFATAFLFISLSYFVQSIINFVLLAGFDDDISIFMNFQNVYLVNLFGIYLHSILFLIGLSMLAYVTMKVERLGPFLMFLAVTLISLFFSPNKAFMLYLLSSVILLFTLYYYLNNYIRIRKVNTLLMLVAILFLLLGYIQFIFSIHDNFMDSPAFYVLGHVFELVAYVLVLVNLMLVLSKAKGGRSSRIKNGKKTR
jgi:hypothetical protein